mmetsp:Transcript_7843/g.1023  ORF Transcript_7843/g.1023 Transcript_7843/m.1023 type:complete len:90 (+) Transcript_7843:122-391(+)
MTGTIDSVETGFGCGSDTAHMSIFDYDPINNYRGRGSFESMGAGIDMNAGDIAFKCNFATLNSEGVVISRRVCRNFPNWGLPLSEFLNG